jgi:hypothetical protein
VFDHLAPVYVKWHAELERCVHCARRVQQESAIPEVRNLYDSKIAEQDILQQSAMKGPLSADFAELDEVGRQFWREHE